MASDDADSVLSELVICSSYLGGGALFEFSPEYVPIAGDDWCSVCPDASPKCSLPIISARLPKLNTDSGMDALAVEVS